MSLRSMVHRLPEPVQQALRDRFYPTLLAEGEAVPEWHLQAADGNWHRHNNNRWTVMVFYVADGDPASAKQLSDLQAHLPKLREIGAEVYGINAAEADSHQAFAKELGLQFPLLTDRGGSVARQFRAAIGLPFRTVLLSTVYLVNPDRKIRMANRGTPPAAVLVRSIEALQQATKRGM